MASIVPRSQGRNTNMDSVPAPTRSNWPRTLRNGLVAALVAIALFALVGFLIIPVVAKGKLEALASQELGRTTTLRRLEFNPFTLRARLFDLAMADREPQRALFRFETLDVDLSLESLWKRAPVFDAVRLSRPQVDLVRNADGRYNIDDLIERIGKEPEGTPAPFSINNIEVDDGTVALDDRPHNRKVVVSRIGIGIPFLSSFPYDAQIHVTPRFDGAIDGAAFALTGSSTSPFEDTKEAKLDLNLDALSLPRYSEYVPLPRGIVVRDGALTTRLALVFATDKGVARSVALSGTARIDKLAVARADGSALASAAAVDIALARLDALARSIAVDKIAVDAPDLDVRRDADGTPEIARLLGGASPSGSAASSGPGWNFAVGEAHVSNGKVHLTDSAVSPTFVTELSSIGMDAARIASNGAPGTFALRFETDEGAQFTAQGQADVAQGAVRGRFELTKIRVGTFRAYYAPASDAEFRKGTLDFASDFEFARDGDAARMTLGNGTAAFSDVEAMLPGEREPALRLARAELTGIALDATKRTFTIDSVAGSQGLLRVLRDRAGAINIEQFTRPSKALEAAERRVSADSSQGQVWNVVMRAVKFEGIGVDVEDRAPEKPVRLRLSDARLAAQNVGNAPGANMTFDAAAKTRPAGRMAIKGAVVAEPLKVDCRIDASGIDLVPLRPYYETATNVIVTGGAAATKGRLTYAAARAGNARARYTGDVTISNFGSLDRPTSQDLVRWKTLTLTDVDAVSEPFSLSLGAVAADGFYARIILNADATLNLQQLLAPQAAAQAAAPIPSTTAGGVAMTTLPDKPGGALPVSIGRIQLTDGEVQYADYFVQPNYTAHLTKVAGTVSALSQVQAGTVEIVANVEGTAPVAISGTVNPFALQLALDLRQGDGHRPPAADALLREVRRLRHSEGQAVARSPLSRRRSEACGNQQAQARPADVRRARRKPDGDEAASTAGRIAAQGPQRRHQSRPSHPGHARRPEVLGVGRHRPDFRQPDHQGDHGTVRAVGLACRRWRRATCVHRVRARSRGPVGGGKRQARDARQGVERPSGIENRRSGPRDSRRRSRRIETCDARHGAPRGKVEERGGRWCVGACERTGDDRCRRISKAAGQRLQGRRHRRQAA
jgi:uncharacterized protein involved in outer membrane biogenesis